jgi:peptide/nickel transport system substrate-binding protein
VSTGATWTLHHYFYDFHIRTSPVVTFYDSTGVAVGTLGSDDVVYSLQRGLANDQAGSPVWMYYKPLFDQMDSSAFFDTGTHTPASGAWLLAKLIGDTVQDMGGNVVRINVGIPFADVGFKQVITQTWGSIMEKDWTLPRSNFNGNLYQDTTPADGIPDWAVTCLKHAEPFNAVSSANYAGSGPYMATVVNQAANLVVLSRNPNYWQGWPAVNRKAFLETINIEYITAWTPGRKEAFIASQLDVCAVPRSNQLEIMNPFGEPAYPEVKTIKNISPSLSMDAMFFGFTVDPTSPSLYTGSFPNGIPYNFFNNTDVRLAFDYALDRAAFLTQAWQDEAIVRETPAIFGLVPDYYNYGPDPPWTFTKNIPQVIAHLQAAHMPGDPVSVWDHGGFKLDIFFNAGNEPRRIACQLIKDTFDEINAANGKNFQVVIQGPDWSVILERMEAFTLPAWQIGWLADYADASNWFGPYMHSFGDFTYYQNYSKANGWDTQVGSRTGIVGKDEMIDFAFKTPDGNFRRDLYYDLNDIYVQQNPNLPTSQPLGRRWAKYWVKGWYFNTLYPSQYYYHLYKEDACWADVTSATVGVPDGRTDMRDIGYIAGHFGAKAPDTARSPPYDPKWAPGTYGNGGADVYGDRKVDMRDIGFAAAHFGHRNVP